jgi:hypothetical protein
MAGETSPDDKMRSLVPRSSQTERYNAALDIARQLRAESTERRALRLFGALAWSHREALPVVAGIGAIVIAAVRFASLINGLRRTERRGTQQEKASQIMLVNETQINLSPTQLAIVSRTTVVRQSKDS